jgi:hypothetical protein
MRCSLMKQPSLRQGKVCSLQCPRVRQRSTPLHEIDLEIDQRANDRDSIGGMLRRTCGECSIHCESASNGALCFSFIPSSIKKIPARLAMCRLKLRLGRCRLFSRRSCSISRCKSLWRSCTSISYSSLLNIIKILPSGLLLPLPLLNVPLTVEYIEAFGERIR